MDHLFFGTQLVEYLIDASGDGSAFASISSMIRKQSTALIYGYGHADVDLNVLNNLQFMEARLVFATGVRGVGLIVMVVSFNSMIPLNAAAI